MTEIVLGIYFCTVFVTFHNIYLPFVLLVKVLMFSIFYLISIILNLLSIVNELSMVTCLCEVRNLISYKPLFETMHKKNITEYNLIYKQGMSANTIHRIKKGLPITTETLDTLCFILDCEVQDILVHDKSQ